MNIARAISEKWRKMGPRDRVSWEEKAHCDKERYTVEKDQFKGPWKVPANKRKPKDPTSPKKPVPAYFAFSNGRRQQVKNENPSATNAEVSKLLSNMWKEAPEELRNQYLEEETARRKVYAVDIAEWRRENELKLKHMAEEEARRLTEEASKTAAHQVSQDGSSEGTRPQQFGNDAQMTLEDQEARASEVSSSQNSTKSSIHSRQGMPQIEQGLGVPTAALQQFGSGNASSHENDGGGHGYGNSQQAMSSNELIAALVALSGNPLATSLLSAASTNNTSAPPVPAFNSNTNTDLGELMSQAAAMTGNPFATSLLSAASTNNTSAPPVLAFNSNTNADLGGLLSQVITLLLSDGQLGGIAQTPAPPLLQQYSHAEDSQQQSLTLLQSLLSGQQQQQQQQQTLLAQQLGQQSEQQHQLGGIQFPQPGQLNLSVFLANQGTNASQFWNDRGQQAQQHQLRNPLFGQSQNTFQHIQPRREDERHG